MTEDEGKVFRLRESGSYWMEVDGQIIAMHPDMSRYLGTNPAGTLLWKVLSEGASRADLTQALVDEYAIDAEQAAADVDAYLANLEEHDLLAPTD